MTNPWLLPQKPAIKMLSSNTNASIVRIILCYIAFIAYCHNFHFWANTISTYVSALGYINKLYNMVNPAESFVIKMLLYSIRCTSTADKCLPFTVANIHTLLATLRSHIRDHYNCVLLQAMFLNTFFWPFPGRGTVHFPKRS